MVHLEQGERVVAGTRIDLLANALVVVATARGRPGRGRPPCSPGSIGPRPWAGVPSRLGTRRTSPRGSTRPPCAGQARGAPSRPSGPAAGARGALSFVERGATPLGIVYQTDARASQDVTLAAVFPDAHPPIVYPLAVVAGREARCRRLRPPAGRGRPVGLHPARLQALMLTALEVQALGLSLWVSSGSVAAASRRA